ncbi:retroviral-like aspartic protease family protein [Flavobacterium sp. CAN_S2]|uniref:retroviral-like aspartic protease family protein n=1 Tax=Flavobacterium sp. CAN_S2 TaxID=2787726 RepID=UPI0018C98026
MRKNLLLPVLLLVSFLSKSQSVKIDTIPFTTKSSLLVFKGQINGIQTDFVLDTGASLGVVTSAKATSANIKITGKKNITDSNENVNSMTEAMIETVTIGSFEIKNVKSIVHDMPFLSCNNYYLLGANAINKLNWKIDFEKNILYVSKSTFEYSGEMLEMNINYKNNRHFTTFNIDETEFKNCLIDLGYNDFFEVSEKEPFFKKLRKENQDGIISGSRLTMSLSDMRINKYETLSFDNLTIGNKRFDDLRIEIRANIENKIGLKFFSQLSSIMILNNKNSKYYLKLSNKPISLKMSFDADCLLKNGKLIIVGKSNNSESSAKDLETEEVIKSINGFTATDFKDECDFLLWRIENLKKDNYEIEKLNGQKIIIKKQVLKS